MALTDLDLTRGLILALGVHELFREAYLLLSSSMSFLAPMYFRLMRVSRPHAWPGFM